MGCPNLLAFIQASVLLFSMFSIHQISYFSYPIVNIKTSKFFGKSNTNKYEPFDFKNSICINSSDPSFPPFTTFYYERKTDPNRIPLAFVGTNYKGDTACLFAATFYLEAINLFYIRNGYLGDSCIVGMEGNYLLDVYNSTRQVENKKNANYPTTKSFPYVITALTPWTTCFGHWLTDVIPLLLYLDESVWNMDPVFCFPPIDPNIVQQYFEIIGHPNTKCVTLRHEMVFAENLYVLRGKSEIHTAGFHSFPLLRQKIFDYYNLHAVKPTDYGYMNKERQRHFTNLKELVQTLEQENEKVSFKFVVVNLPDRTTFAKTMATFKLFISPCGSIAYNYIFMHENTGYITLSSRLIDFPNLKSTLDINIFLITVIHQSMSHFNSRGKVDIKRVAYCFKILNQAIEIKKWPTDHKLFLPFNEDYYREKVGNPPNYTLEAGHIIKPLYEEYLKTYSLPSDIP